VRHSQADISKASAIVLPLLLVLIFVAEKQKVGATHASPLQSTDSPFAPARWREPARLLWPFFAVAAVIFVVNVAVGASYGVVKSYRGGFVATALTVTRVVADYIQSILLPTDLSAKYFVIPVTSPLSGAFLSAACLIAVLALLIAAAYVRTRNAGGVQASSLHDSARMAALGGMWFIVALLPFLNIIPTSTLRADRYLYVAMVGAGFIFAGAMTAIPWRGARTALGIVALVCLGALSWQRAHIWKDSVALWLDTVAKSPLSPMSHANLGAAYLERGERDLAEQQFQEALTCDPNFAIALTNLSLIWSEQGKRDQALGAARRAVSADPANADAHLNLGRVLGNMDDLDAAYLHFGEAIRLDPFLADAYYNLALVHLKRGQLDLAESNARKALQLGLTDAQAILDQIQAKIKEHP
jgi:tetratricopeptide (TPR) repeat protein